MNYVFVKDSDGYVFKKLETEVSSDEKIISEKEYMKLSGLASYEKKIRSWRSKKKCWKKAEVWFTIEIPDSCHKRRKGFSCICKRA